MEIIPVSLIQKFAQSLESIRKEHPYTEEIAFMDLSAEVLELLREAENLNDGNFKQFVVSLRNSRLELIFHALTYDISPVLKDKLLAILAARIKKRFFQYNWIMLQEHYTNAYLKESFRLLTEYMQQKHPTEYQQSLASRIPLIEGDLIHQALEVLFSEGCSIQAFFQRFSILPESSFARELLYEYFITCSGEGFHQNAKYFLDMIHHSENRLYLHVNHYLDVLNVLDYIEPVNNLLTERFGMPGESVFWDNIEEQFREKFVEWAKLKDLGKYLGITSEKFLFWRNYHHYITKIDFYPDQGLMFLHLSRFVIVDIKKEKSKSYLYKKPAFNNAFRAYKQAAVSDERVGWPIDKESAVPVKDAILEGVDSDIYVLMYERVGKLYIEDYLEQNL